MSNKEVVGFTIHYSDGSSESVDQALLGRKAGAKGVYVHTVGLDVPDFLTVLAGLESTADALLRDDRI